MSEEKIRNQKGSVNQLPRPDNIPSFLLKTYQILQNQKYSDVICWTKNGQGFLVKKIKEFSENILPVHFRHSNYTSFVRQLNMYDFHKTRQENHENAFKNFMFQRGQKHLLKDIQRKDYKKKKEKTQRSQTKEVRCQTEFKQEERKKTYEKQFYLKGLADLQKIDQAMSKKQNQLAKIQFNCHLNSGQAITDILELFMGVKNLNISWFGNMCNVDKQWQSLLEKKKQVITSQMDAEQIKKCLGPTIDSLNSISLN